MREIRTSGSEGALGGNPQGDPTPENRELDDSQAKATSGRSKAALEDAEAPLRPEVPDTGGDAQSNVKSADSFEPRARVVRDERARGPFGLRPAPSRRPPRVGNLNSSWLPLI